MRWKSAIIRYFSNPNYLSSLSQPFTVSLFSKTLNPLPRAPPSTFLHFHQLHAKLISQPVYSLISSPGSPSFCSGTYPIAFFSVIYPPCLISLASYTYSHSSVHPSFSLGLLRPHDQSRLLSVSSSNRKGEFENMAIAASDESQSRTVREFGSNVTPKQISEIIEVIRNDEDDLEFQLNLMGVTLSVVSISGIFRVLNCERVSALRFFVWLQDTYPSLYCNADVCSLIIDNCGWLDDYETMLCLLKDYRSKRICLSEKAFGFLPVLGSSKASTMESIRRVVELLNEVGGSCRGSGICGLLKMLSKLELFEMAKFVIEITDRKASYYNILILEKCRRYCFGDARGIIEEMRQVSCEPNAKTYNYLLSALCKHNRTAEASIVLEEMQEKGCPPDALTFEIFIYFSCRLGKLDAAVQFFDQMVARGLEPRLTTHAAFIKGFFYSRQYEEAYNYVVASGVKHKNSSHMIYSLLGSLHQRKGDLIAAGNILIEMMDKGFIPYFPVYMRILKRLHKSGKTRLAGDLKRRFSSLRSETSTMT